MSNPSFQLCVLVCLLVWLSEEHKHWNSLCSVSTISLFFLRMTGSSVFCRMVWWHILCRSWQNPPFSLHIHNFTFFSRLFWVFHRGPSFNTHVFKWKILSFSTGKKINLIHLIKVKIIKKLKTLAHKLHWNKVLMLPVIYIYLNFSIKLSVCCIVGNVGSDLFNSLFFLCVN